MVTPVASEGLDRQVPGSGSLDARIVGIAEAPADHEVRARTPLVGPSGRLLERDLWLPAGLKRGDFRLENVSEERGAGNKIEALGEARIKAWMDDLHVRLAKLRDPYVLVPMGNYALYALTQRGRVSWDTRKPGISVLRGSIYEYVDLNGRRIKVIPTVHPSALFRTPTWTKRCVHDWKRVAGDATFREARLHEAEHFISPTLDDVEWYVEETLRTASALAIDIETPRRATYVDVVSPKTGKRLKPKRTLGYPYIAMVGFATSPSFSFTVPTTEQYWGSRERCDYVWRLVRKLCESSLEKILQNGLFDAWWLAREQGIRLVNYRWDCKALHHCIDSTDDHDLAYMASVETRMPYWKAEAKDPDELQQYTSDFNAFQVYNGKDCVSEYAIGDALAARVYDAGRLPFYLRHYRNLFAPLLDISLGGIRVDVEQQQRLRLWLAERTQWLRNEVATLAGADLYGKKSLSNKKLTQYLYETLRLPKQLNRKTKSLSAAEVTVRKLMNRYPDKLRDVGTLILDQRRTAQLATFAAERRVAADGVMRSSYGFSPETGRLSSSAAPDRTGSNAQNQDREVRGMFVADEGHVLLECDLSQAESRMVGMFTGDAELMRLARTPPWEFDVHTYNAAIVFRCDESTITKAQRYLGKRAVHGSNYGLHGKKLAEELSKDGYTLDDDECEAMVQSYLGRFPAITAWQRRVRQTVLRDGALTNPFGRTISFKHERFNDDLWRRGYAFGPQSTCADLLNVYGLVPMYQWLAQHADVDARIVAHVHDALIFSVAPQHAYDVACAVVACLERPVTYPSGDMVVPVEFKCGPAWGTGREWKRLPARAEFDAAITG